MHASHSKRELIYGSHKRRSSPEQSHSDPHGKENLKIEINKSLMLPFALKLTLQEDKGEKRKRKEASMPPSAERGAPSARSRAPHLPHGELPIIHPAGKGLRRATGRRAGIHQVSCCTQVFPPRLGCFYFFFFSFFLSPPPPFFYPLLGGEPFLRQCQVSQPSFPAY